MGQQDRFAAWPRFFFISFFLILLFATLFFSPGWGFMDDWQCGQNAQAFWQGKTSLSKMVSNDISGYGRFRPVYYAWVVGVYWIKQPLVIYLLVLTLGFMALFAWGKIIDRLFPRPAASSFNQFLYPLMFFVFLPFWNIFMYLSVQEKFVVIFGALSLLFLARGYQKGSARDFVLSIILAIVGMLGKETGVAFLAAYGAFAFLDVCFFRKDRKRSLMLLAACLVLGIGYVVFMKGVLGGYTQGYKTNLNMDVLLGALTRIPSVLKAVLVLAGVSGLWAAVDWMRGKRDFDPLFLVCPIWIVFYIALLLPWGFPHYLLAPLAPFVMACAYYVLHRLVLGRSWGLAVVQAGVVICVLAVLCGEILPRLSKMADKRKVIEALVSLNAKTPATFFYPPVYEETSMALERFSGAKVHYAAVVNEQSLNPQTANYLVINDESSGMLLRGVALGDEVYKSGTWLIREIQLSPGAESHFRLELSKNAVQKLKGFLTSH